MNYGKLTAGITKTAIDTAKSSEKGEIITYLSRMGDVLEYIVKRQHFHSFARRGVNIFVNGDKGNAKRGIYDFCKAISFDMLTTKTG